MALSVLEGLKASDSALFVGVPSRAIASFIQDHDSCVRACHAVSSVEMKT